LCYVTKYVGLCTLSLSDLDFSVAIYIYIYDRLTFVRPIEFHLNTYRPTYADAFTFVGAGLCVVV